MKKAIKKKPNLTVAQICMSANFYDASADFPKASFAENTVRMLGPKGFAGEKHAALYRKECLKAFNLAR
jgi:hypothetical protein